MSAALAFDGELTGKLCSPVSKPICIRPEIQIIGSVNALRTSAQLKASSPLYCLDCTVRTLTSSFWRSLRYQAVCGELAMKIGLIKPMPIVIAPLQQGVRVNQP